MVKIFIFFAHNDSLSTKKGHAEVPFFMKLNVIGKLLALSLGTRPLTFVALSDLQ